MLVFDVQGALFFKLTGRAYDRIEDTFSPRGELARGGLAIFLSLVVLSPANRQPATWFHVGTRPAMPSWVFVYAPTRHSPQARFVASNIRSACSNETPSYVRAMSAVASFSHSASRSHGDLNRGARRRFAEGLETHV